MDGNKLDLSEVHIYIYVYMERERARSSINIQTFELQWLWFLLRSEMKQQLMRSVLSQATRGHYGYSRESLWNWNSGLTNYHQQHTKCGENTQSVCPMIKE